MDLNEARKELAFVKQQQKVYGLSKYGAWCCYKGVVAYLEAKILEAKARGQ